MSLVPRIFEALVIGAFFGVFFALAMHVLKCIEKKVCRWDAKTWFREALFSGGFFALGWFLLGFF